MGLFVIIIIDGVKPTQPTKDARSTVYKLQPTGYTGHTFQSPSLLRHARPPPAVTGWSVLVSASLLLPGCRSPSRLTVPVSGATTVDAPRCRAANPSCADAATWSGTASAPAAPPFLFAAPPTCSTRLRFAAWSSASLPRRCHRALPGHGLAATEAAPAGHPA